MENNDRILLQANQSPDCLTIIQENSFLVEDDMIHVCDWPALRAAIDAFQERRNA